MKQLQNSQILHSYSIKTNLAYHLVLRAYHSWWTILFHAVGVGYEHGRNDFRWHQLPSPEQTFPDPLCTRQHSCRLFYSLLDFVALERAPHTVYCREPYVAAAHSHISPPARSIWQVAPLLAGIKQPGHHLGAAHSSAAIEIEVRLIHSDKCPLVGSACKIFFPNMPHNKFDFRIYFHLV